MGLSFLGLWYVCALGSAVFAAGTPARPVTAAVAMATFAAAAWWVFPAGAIDVTTAGLFAAGLACWDVTRRVPRAVPAAAAGALAGLWSGVLALQGLPWIAALLVAAAIPATSLVLASTRRVFAPRALLDEALLVVGALGLAAAALPVVAEGWRAAGNLALQDAPLADQALVPTWAIVMTGTAALLGGLHAVWSRR